MGTPTDINERINHLLWRRSISLHRDPVGETWRGAPLLGTLRVFFFDIQIWVPFLDPDFVANFIL